ncbi:hypothetical protein BKA67DRAFT_618608 [Truncatella angustata]|uniref:G domain-containing protein n=1 Tax=Truncatella angustata TaxID=152316 RepID=A0A9P9A103_9PEZI|nr:uncharacterized protein BKA67DRAFT_618608 [Truncatella angustata]KAH6656525.1 hypothetical protein BKA67DRAFT_618608 [Truncatella angustata]
MSTQRTMKRLVVLVDGAEERYGEAQRESSIKRLHSLVTDGLITGSAGQNIIQTRRYYTCVGKPPKLADKFKVKIYGDDTDVKIKSIVKDICSTLESPEDELYLFGSGHGSFVARAAAGVIHHMGLPLRASLTRFDDIYDCTCALQKARAEDDNKNGPRLLESIRPYTGQAPRIQFVGLFDSFKMSSTTTTYETGFVTSIKHIRMALALNEARSGRGPDLLKHGNLDMNEHSFIQAWFIGSVDDMCGGVQHDGLSLYPLQWMLIESMKAGLAISPIDEPAVKTESPLTLVFPQYAGGMPNLDDSEDIHWSFKYTNGIQVSMFDLQAAHAGTTTNQSGSHSLRLDNDCFSRTTLRKVFSSTSLKGWNPTGAYGTIIHLSVFCILDRFPKYLELNSFKPLKRSLADYQADCVLDNATSLPPWLQGMQLQASGVKAFRILVCGKTGVGKSTLINKVFGVEMTEESLSYDQGVHDINKAFESPKHPGLLIHDSRGWQAGSDTELELIAKFLRHRAFQKDAAEALHVIWFCVDADVSRIEEADKKTFETISQFSHDVPVFVVGTKKDKLVGYRKMQLLEEYMAKSGDYKEAIRLANEEANQSAEDQFSQLRSQLSQIKHYKADGYCCLSKDDDIGIKSLITQTLGLIADERVRLFCVAAQVVDVDQKINSAITECMRLGTHAIRTAAVPLPFSGMIGTPTVSRLICEHVLQCFGFPKATPAEVEAIMTNVVMVNFKKFMTVSLTQFVVISAVTLGVGFATAGIGTILGIAGCLLSVPPAARMLLKCSCDMILILERSFRYEGKYVSVKQIEDAARYYTSTTIKTFAGKDKRLQQQVHDSIDEMIPLKKVHIGLKFNKLRGNVEDIIYASRFGKPPDYPASPASSSINTMSPSFSRAPTELTGSPRTLSDLHFSSFASELEGDTAPISNSVTLRLDSEKVLGSLSDLGLGADNPRGAVSGRPAELEARRSSRSAVELEGDTLIGSPREELPGSMPTLLIQPSEAPSVSKSKWKPSWLRSKKSKNKL